MDTNESLFGKTYTKCILADGRNHHNLARDGLVGVDCIGDYNSRYRNNLDTN